MAKSLFRICGRGFFAWRAPRMWGIPEQARTRQPAARFIPTHVRNTHPPPAALRRDAVHPHACGEYAAWDLYDGPMPGSSPRVWGIPDRPGSDQQPHRFIPTRVGNTLTAKGPMVACPVHPHACGEYVIERQFARLQHGSSPRVWGIPAAPDRPGRGSRFIPTRVGNTLAGRLIRRLVAVHPHACGEYGHMAAPQTKGYGSSPRVWGIQNAGGAGC